MDETSRLIVPVLAAVGATLLIWRRQAPVLVFAAELLISLVAPVIVPDYHPTASLLVALSAVAETRSTGYSAAAGVLALVPSSFSVAVNLQFADPETRTGEVLISAAGYLLVTFSAWLIGRWQGRSRTQLQVAERRRLVAVEREQRQAERVLTERQHIARELHDIVAHTVTLMVLHAAAAGRILDLDPEGSKRSLKVIEDSGTQAMAELRRMLEVLNRSGMEADSADPSEGLDRLDDLIERARAENLQVTLRIIGEARALDPSVGLAGYRFFQEGLTNVARHAGPGTTVDISIEWTDRWAELSLRDDGAGEPEPVAGALSTGNGLIGLHERITIAGGIMDAAKLPHGGFRMYARLPVAAAAGNGRDREDVTDTDGAAGQKARWLQRMPLRTKKSPGNPS